MGDRGEEEVGGRGGKGAKVFMEKEAAEEEKEKI